MNNQKQRIISGSLKRATQRNPRVQPNRSQVASTNASTVPSRDISPSTRARSPIRDYSQYVPIRKTRNTINKTPSQHSVSPKPRHKTVGNKNQLCRIVARMIVRVWKRRKADGLAGIIEEAQSFQWNSQKIIQQVALNSQKRIFKAWSSQLNKFESFDERESIAEKHYQLQLMVNTFNSWQKFHQDKKLDPEHKSIIEEMDSILLSMNASSVIADTSIPQVQESPSKFLITFSNDFKKTRKRGRQNSSKSNKTPKKQVVRVKSNKENYNLRNNSQRKVQQRRSILTPFRQSAQRQPLQENLLTEEEKLMTEFYQKRLKQRCFNNLLQFYVMQNTIKDPFEDIVRAFRMNTIGALVFDTWREFIHI